MNNIYRATAVIEIRANSHGEACRELETRIQANGPHDAQKFTPSIKATVLEIVTKDATDTNSRKGRS
jgi:hypothetical protein